MYEVYILLSANKRRTYTGYAKSSRNRLIDHNSGKVRVTRHYKPWTILFIEKCNTLTEAKNRERYWKSGAGRRELKKYFKKGSRSNYLDNLSEARPV